MFAVIGQIVVWGFGLVVVIVAPMIVGMIVSDRRRDDGLAAYAAIPVTVVLMGLYIASTVGYLAVT